MSMMSLKEDTDKVLERNYKVCYFIDDKKIKTGTFINKLANIDNTYFWFSSVEYGLSIIRQDMIVYMGCVDEPKKSEDVALYGEITDITDLKYYVQKFKNKHLKNPKRITGNIETLKNLFSEFMQKPLCYNLYCGIRLDINNNIPFGFLLIR